MSNPRLPNSVHRMRGTFRRDRHDPNAPVLPPAMPEKPAGMTADVEKTWDLTGGLLHRAGFLAETDGDLLHHYCELQSEFRRDPPGFTAAKHAQLRLLRGELGLTPMSRGKVPISRPERLNKFADLMNELDDS